MKLDVECSNTLLRIIWRIEFYVLAECVLVQNGSTFVASGSCYGEICGNARKVGATGTASDGPVLVL